MAKVAGLPWLVWGVLGLVIAVVLAGILVRAESETADPAGQAGLEEPVEPLPPGLPEGGSDDPNVLSSCRHDNPNRVSWGDAGRNLNEKVALFGPVSAIRPGANGSVVLEVGDVQELPDVKPVMVVLLQTTLARLPGRPEELFADKAICAIGIPQRIGDEIRLQINEPSEISVF